jgi:hypothetical protein
VNRKKIKNLLLVYGIPLLLGVIVRVLLFSDWFDSPVKYYCHIIGLDMENMLRNGMLFHHGKQKFLFYYLLVSVSTFFKGGNPCLDFIILIQLILGLVSSLLVSFIAMRLWGKKHVAIIAGSLMAIYSPALMYEILPLKESTFLFSLVLSLAVLLKARKKHFTMPWSILAGMCCLAPLLYRKFALLWVMCCFSWMIWYIFFRNYRINRNIPQSFKLSLKPFAGLAIGIILLITPISLFNYRHLGIISPFYDLSYKLSINYTLKVGQQSTPDINFKTEVPSINTTKTNNPKSKLYIYGNKLLNIIDPTEASNNVNFYFLKYQLLPLAYLPDAGLLFPLAFLGLLILIVKKRIFKREGILFLYLIALSIPMCLFLVLARYRLVIIPIFCLVASFPLASPKHFIPWIKFETKRNGITAYIFTACLSVLIVRQIFPVREFLRADDYIVHGKALKIQKGNVPGVTECFIMAMKLDPTSSYVATILSDQLIQQRQNKLAEELLKSFAARYPNDFKINLNYSAALLGNGKAKEAEFVLSNLKEPSNEKQKVRYFFNLGQSRLLQKNKNGALKAYLKALSYADSPKLKNIITNQINAAKAIR